MKNTIFITCIVSCISYAHPVFGQLQTAKLATGELPPWTLHKLKGFGCFTEIVTEAF